MSADEDKITEWFAGRSRLSAEDFPIGIGDDMAQVRLGGGESVLVTTDMVLEGVHFDLTRATVEQVGYKAMAVSLSDCAAMATEPVAAVVAVALPEGFGEQQLKQLHSGITSAGEKFGCRLIGGDITSWGTKGPLAIAVAMMSRCGDNEPVKRSGARVGDRICVTGTLGGSLQGKHLQFEPRVKEAIMIAKTVRINSMIDISDGLSSDLNRICRQSKVGAIIEAKKIPISEAAKEGENPLGSALNDGEDFELLFTLSQEDCNRLLKHWSGPVPITNIGRVTEDKKLQIRGFDGEISVLMPGGFDHLSK